MKLLRIYFRVLALLGREGRLAWALAVANLALASAMFVEPILFGRIVDTLANAQPRVSQIAWRDLMLLVGAWVAFGLFIIVCSTLVALHADRLAHRQYQVVRTMFFEHVLQLPLSYYTGSHSGRLVKVMITGTNTLWALWLSFFREHFASIISLIVLLPLTLFINWRYGLLLILLCTVFGVVIALVVRKVEQLQSTVEGHYTDVAERTSDALGNIALVQSFTRIEAEVSGMRKMGEEVLRAQIPVLSWWAVTTVITRTSTTLTMLSILVLGVWFYLRGQTTVGEIVMFMSFATLLIGKLDQAVHFANEIVMDAPRLPNSSTCSTPSRRCATALMPWIPGTCAGSWNSRTSRFPMTASARQSRISASPRCPAKRSPSSAQPGRASRPRLRFCTAPLIHNPAR